MDMKTRIAVISDTHINSPKGALPPELIEKIGGVDMILHAGDISTPKTLNDLSLVASVEAVAGNMDSTELAYILPVKRTLTIRGHKIGLIHGYGHPANITSKIRREFGPVSCIVFGHTHYPMNKIIDGTLFFNPGSPTDKRFAEFNTFGILEITEESIKGYIVKL